MRLAQFLLSACLLLTCAAPSAVHAQSADLRGTVTDAQDRPIPSVNLVLERTDAGEQIAGTSTTVDGTFRIDAVPPGTYRLVASAVGYAKATQTMTLEANTQRRVSLRLESKSYGLDEVVVSATRTREALGSVASSVSVLGPQDLQSQSAVTGDLGDMLAQTVPGLAPSNGSLSNFGQTMRGRSPFVMIDGVPQNTPLRDGARSLRTSSPEAIERIEVVRGASALYGYGATGGAINIITREPTSELEGTTEVGVHGSGADVSESFTGRLHQSISGREGGVGFVASGSYESWGQFYDGRGTLIPQDPRGQGGLAGADEWGLFGKVDAPVAPSQRVSASVNYYSFRQDLEYGRQPGTYGETPTAATSTGTLPPKNPGTDNIVGQVRYEHTDLLGSEVSAQAYVQDFKTYYGYSTFFPGGGQPLIESTKYGLRLDATTPLGWTQGSQLLWGVDALRDQTAQPLADGRTFAPEMTQASAAPFVQLRVPLAERLTLRGGARYEALSVDVVDFTTLRPQFDTDGDGTPDQRNDVEGGTLTYDNLAFNAGVVFTVAKPVDLFASFQQGFAVSEIGRVLRSTVAESVEVLNPEARTVNSYEVGARVATQSLTASATGYYTTSDLGSSYGSDFEIIRSPEHVYGLEATTDLQVIDPLAVGGTFSWVKGKRDADDNGSYETPLPGNRIPPEKITGYVEVTPLDGWTGRLQLLYSGSRDAFPSSSAYAKGEVSPYTVVDLSSRVDVGPGALTIGIENLFDNYYFPVRSQYPALDDSYTPGRGRNVTLSYSVTW
ncbi:iron complex outermembrane receptor protein [Salinibacter ruber]|jgi:iron complex outermembrane receptor protein|uniref:TonB-dependent receptor n=2 Tax=Salinibacter ruber TaxID=146919 RepID=UPI0021670C18|nr:TonB-dependent receptor [Salinibacter ruber]MCS3667293.1 iron complex outermembrane receptor protein [Salinibacter ruber]